METKECSSCKTPNPVFASYCRKCGTRFPEHTKPGKSNMCHIENFAVKKQTKGKFLVEWNAINADKVTINGSDVTGKNKFVTTVKGSHTILLRADNSTSYDVKEVNVVYESQTIYKDKNVEKKVTSGTNVFAVVFLLIFILLSALLIHYAYQLENRNYSGDRYLSNIFGYKPYLLVNGTNKSRTVNIPAQGASLMYDVYTNSTKYEVLDLPNWCTLEKSGSQFIIKATENRQSDRTCNIRVKTGNDEVTMRLEQKVYKPTTECGRDSLVTMQKITGEIDSVTVEHDVYENDVKGMKIHIKFSVQNMKGIQGLCGAYMYYEDGTPLKDTNGSYKTFDGQCAFGKDFTPTYDNSTFNDFIIFVPLKELEAPKGQHNMKFFCAIWDNSSGNSTSIAISDYYSFTLTKN